MGFLFKRKKDVSKTEVEPTKEVVAEKLDVEHIVPLEKDLSEYTLDFEELPSIVLVEYKDSLDLDGDKVRNIAVKLKAVIRVLSPNTMKMHKAIPMAKMTLESGKEVFITPTTIFEVVGEKAKPLFKITDEDLSAITKIVDEDSNFNFLVDVFTEDGSIEKYLK